MSKKKNIEELFKQGFQNFEAPVDPVIWSNIQAGIGAGSATAAGGVSLVKAIIIGAVAAGLIAGGIFIATSGSEPSTQEKGQTTKDLASAEDKKEDTKPKEDNSQKATVQNKETDTNVKDKPNPKADENATGSDNKDYREFSNTKDDKGATSDDAKDNQKDAGSPEKPKDEGKGKEPRKETKLISKINGSDLTGEAPLRARFNIEANTDDITWNVKNSSGELINVIAGKDFDMNFTETGAYLVQVNTVLDDKSSQEELLIEVTEQVKEHTEKFGFEMDKSILDLKQEAIVLDMNNPLRSELKFNVTVNQIKVFKLSIYDGNTRQLIYESTNIDDRNWKGTDMSGSLVKGSYYFMEAVAGNGDNELEIIRKRVDIISNR